MFLIHNTLCEDAKILDIEEEPTPSGLYERIQTNPDYLEEESFYTKALTNIKTLLQKQWKELYPLLNFLRTPREDILDYGTIPDYTLWIIANLSTIDENQLSRVKIIDEFTVFMNEVGEDYLERERKK